MRNLKSAYWPIIAKVHLHWMIYAIEPPGLPFNFRSRVSPACPCSRTPSSRTCLGCAALTQLPDLFHRRDHQLYLRLRVDQGGLSLLIVECLGFVRVEHAVRKSDDLARLRPLHGQRVNSPDEFVIFARSSRKSIWLIAPCSRRPRLLGRGRRLGPVCPTVAVKNWGRSELHPFGQRVKSDSQPFGCKAQF